MADCSYKEVYTPVGALLGTVGRELHDLQERVLQLEQRVLSVCLAGDSADLKNSHVNFQEFDLCIQSLQALGRYLLALEEKAHPDHMIEIQSALKQVHLETVAKRLSNTQDQVPTDIQNQTDQKVELF